MLQPKRTKYKKIQKGRIKGLSHKGSSLSFGDFGIKALEPTWITSRQIEATRIVLSRNIKKNGKIWIRIFPNKPITKKPAEVRMGKGKGPVEYWVSVVKPGKIMFCGNGGSAADAQHLAAEFLVRLTSDVNRQSILCFRKIRLTISLNLFTIQKSHE